MVAEVRVEGLRELTKALRQVDKDLPKEVQRANKAIAESVADKTRASFAGRGGVAPKVAASVKALASQRDAKVRIGGNRWPYAMGAEYGSLAFKQFDPWRGSHEGAGYSLWPTIRSQRTEIEDEFLRSIDAIARRAFPD